MTPEAWRSWLFVYKFCLPPLPVEPYPLKTLQTLLYAVGVVTARLAVAVAYLRVSGPLGPLTSVYHGIYRSTTHSDEEN